MNIKYLFVVSLTLFFIFPKNIIAQAETIDLDLISIDAYSDDDDLLFPSEDGIEEQQVITSNARALQNSTPTRGIYTDDFLYRWYVQAGVGAQFIMGEDDSKGSFMGRQTLAPAITAGYRLNPVFGLRLNISGGSLHGFNDGHAGTYRFWKGKSEADILALQGQGGFPDNIMLDGITHWDPQWNYKGWTMGNNMIGYDIERKGYNWSAGGPNGGLYMQHLRYAAANAAVTMNLFNLFAGADDTRKFDVSMHLGPTYFHVFPHMGVEAYDGFGINGGIQGQYHLNEKFAVFAELNGSMMPDGFDGHYGGDTFDLIGQALLGVTYKLPTDKWERTPVIPRGPAVLDVGMDDELARIRAELLAEMNQMVDLQPEIDRLREQLAALSRVETVQEVIEPVKESFFYVDPVHFAIGKTDIDAEAWGVIERVAAYLNNNPTASVIVTGYADKATGTAEINERLSRERSKKIADALVYRYNIAQGRVAIDWLGDNMQPFHQNQMNRAVLFYIEFD